MTAPRDVVAVPDRAEDIRATIDRCVDRSDEAFVDRWPNFAHELGEDEDGERLERAWLERNRGVQ